MEEQIRNIHQHLTASKLDEQKVLSLIKDFKGNINDYIPGEIRPLIMTACKIGNFNIIKLLFEKGVKKETHKHGAIYFAVCNAARKGHLHILAYLESVIPGCIHENTIVEAAISYQFDVVEYLILKYKITKIPLEQSGDILRQIIKDVCDKHNSCLMFSKLYKLFDSDTSGIIRGLAIDWFRADILRVISDSIENK